VADYPAEIYAPTPLIGFGPTNPHLAFFYAATYGGSAGAVTNYRMRASCTSAPGGYIYWTNQTGDSTNAPTCSGTRGPNTILETWES
jgi:hypothetical protein